MKRILLVASEPSAGMIPFAATIINSLSRDSRFDVCCICVGSDAYKKYIDASVKSIFVDLPSNKISKLIGKVYPYKLIRIIKKTAKDFKPDYIHFLTGDFTLASFIRVNKDSRYCYTVHDLHAHPLGKVSLKQKIMNSIINKGYASNTRNCLNLTTSSREQLNELKSKFPQRNIAYTSFPTLVTNDIESGSAEIPEIRGMSSYVLFFGGVKEYKGVDDLVYAFLNMQKPQNLNLVIAGKGKSYENVDKSIVHVNRMIDDAEIKDLFAKAQVVVYPYTSATMSGVLSIAYYFQKKVLLSDLSFFKDNETECCTFFKAGDRNDLMRKLQMIVTEPNSDTFNCYPQMFSAKTLTDDYARFYKIRVCE